MTTPATRTPVRIARGTFANLSGSIVDLQQGEIVYAVDQNLFYVVEAGVLTPQGYATSGDLNSYAALSGATFTGPVQTSGSVTFISGFTSSGNTVISPSTISGTALFVSGASQKTL